MMRPMRAAASLLCVLCLASACAQRSGPLPAFDGPGRLLLVVEDDSGAALLVIDADGVHTVRVDAPREVRWIDPERLLVSREVPARSDADPFIRPSGGAAAGAGA